MVIVICSCVVDECDSVDSCGPNAQCLYDSVASRYHCVCNVGYDKSPDKLCVESSGRFTFLKSVICRI